jgi:hypothetical protein
MTLKQGFEKELAGAEHLLIHLPHFLYFPLTPGFVYRVDAKSLYWRGTQVPSFLYNFVQQYRAPALYTVLSRGLDSIVKLAAAILGLHSTYRHWPYWQA